MPWPNSIVVKWTILEFIGDRYSYIIKYLNTLSFIQIRLHIPREEYKPHLMRIVKNHLTFLDELVPPCSAASSLGAFFCLSSLLAFLLFWFFLLRIFLSICHVLSWMFNFITVLPTNDRYKWNATSENHLIKIMLNNFIIFAQVQWEHRLSSNTSYWIIKLWCWNIFWRNIFQSM